MINIFNARTQLPGIVAATEQQALNAASVETLQDLAYREEAARLGGGSPEVTAEHAL